MLVQVEVLEQAAILGCIHTSMHRQQQQESVAGLSVQHSGDITATGSIAAGLVFLGPGTSAVKQQQRLCAGMPEKQALMPQPVSVAAWRIIHVRLASLRVESLHVPPIRAVLVPARSSNCTKGSEPGVCMPVHVQCLRQRQAAATACR